VAIVCGKGKTNAVQQTKMTQTEPKKKQKSEQEKKMVQQQHKQREMVVPLRFHGQLKAEIAFCDCTYRQNGWWSEWREL